MAGYDFASVEKKWQAYWEAQGTFVQPNPGQAGFADRPKYYVLDMFPYPSGAGLHVGHPEGYTATDIVARYRRMKGFNVLHPMGYDSFGLPAEQYAVEHGVHPRETTERNIANIERQIKMMGFSYDWSRRLATTDVGYYRWTQWIFLQLYNSWYDPEANAARPISEMVSRLQNGQLVIGIDGQIKPMPGWRKIPEMSLMTAAPGEVKFYELDVDTQRQIINDQRLAYLDEVPVNWCPMLGTVLANEEVTNEGRSERGDHPVYRRALKQWMLRITAYADRLLEDLDLVDWPEPIKAMQRNWIGKSSGAEVDFPVPGTTGVSPVAAGSITAAFRRFSEGDRTPLLSARSFVGRDPYPPGDPSPTDLMGHIRSLPHLRLSGGTYFVTFHAAEGVTFTPDEQSLLLDACLYWHGQKCCTYAAVALNNHVHLLVQPIGDESLEDLLHSIKSFTSHEVNKRRGTKGPIWEGETFDHIVRNEVWFTRFVHYICDNPVKYKLVDRPDRYPWLWLNPDEVVVAETQEKFGFIPAKPLLSQQLEIVDEWFQDRAQSGFPGEPDDSSEFGDRRDACRTIRVYTTRPDTLFGATYMVLAPEHPLVSEIVPGSWPEGTPDSWKGMPTDRDPSASPENASAGPWSSPRDAVNAYVAQSARKSELERTAEAKEKTGVFTGAYAINPVTRRPIPIWVADYVLMGYGTGAIMAVPAHDTRDLEFARKFDLPVVQVVQPPAGTSWEGFVGDGTAVNSGPYDGLSTPEFKTRVTADLAKAGLGRGAVNYKLRDWLFSRQRYWGEPFPIVHCQTCGVVALREDQLPLELPEMADFTPACSSDPDALPQPPLGKAAEWVKTTCSNCGAPAQRELNTMPQWAGSCWYFLRYLDPKNDKRFCDPKIEKYWMGADSGSQSKIENQKSEMGVGIDLYVGGAEHAVLHLLYSRFWHKVLFDLGQVSTPEPFGRLFNQGMIRSFAYRDKRGVYVGYDDIDFSGPKPRHKQTGEELAESVEKMSKSLRNVVTPDAVVAEYGADTLRLYEMFMGPLDASKPWNTRDVPGVHRFLNRVWRMIVGDEDSKSLVSGAQSDLVEKALHKLIKKAGEDIEAMKFNTPIAAMMEFVNAVYKAGAIALPQVERFLLVLAPFAPHVAEELWQSLGHPEGLAHEPWPAYDPALIAEETVELAVQVNGKVRAKITVPVGASKEECVAAAKADAKIAELLAGKSVVKEIVAPGRLVNLVVK